MTGVLSADEIAALVEAAKQGDLPEAPARETQRRPRRVHTIDFSRPTKFTQEQQRRIERAHETFCRTTATQLSAELRAPIELEVLNVVQQTWAGAVSDIPPSLYGVVMLEPAQTMMLLSVELDGVHRLVTRLLGGSEPGQAPDRPPTEIELTVSRRVLETLVTGLAPIWVDLLGLQPSLAALETQPQSIQLAPPSEPSLSITLEMREPRSSSTIAIVVPHRAIGHVVERLSSSHQWGDAHDAEDQDEELLRASLATIDAEARVEVGAVELTIDEVLRLGEGDIVSLGIPASTGVTVYVDGVPVHHARPGRSGTRRAVQILDRLAPR